MKMLKRLGAALLILAIVLSLTACHKKDEIAVTAGDYKFTSAYYMCALMAADTEAKGKVDEAKAEKAEKEEASDSEEAPEETDYYSEKIDDKDYVTWVEDKAIENLKKIAAYKTLCKENELKLDEETETSVTSYADYYWSSYGYSLYYEPNGVSKATYSNYLRDSYYSSLYFDHLYGKDGEKEIASKDVKETIKKNFIIANILTADFAEKGEEDIKAEKNKFKKFVKQLKSGEKTFDEIYEEYNGPAEQSAEQSADTQQPAPKDDKATILGAEGTNYESPLFEEVRTMKLGSVKVIENEDGSGINLVVKKNLAADKYYFDTLDTEARHLIADDEFDKDILEYANKLKCDISKYAIGQFKVKKIKEPEYS